MGRRVLAGTGAEGCGGKENYPALIPTLLREGFPTTAG